MQRLFNKFLCNDSLKPTISIYIGTNRLKPQVTVMATTTSAPGTSSDEAFRFQPSRSVLRNPMLRTSDDSPGRRRSSDSSSRGVIFSADSNESVKFQSSSSRRSNESVKFQSEGSRRRSSTVSNRSNSSNAPLVAHKKSDMYGPSRSMVSHAPSQKSTFQVKKQKSMKDMLPAMTNFAPAEYAGSRPSVKAASADTRKSMMARKSMASRKSVYVATPDDGGESEKLRKLTKYGKVKEAVRPLVSDTSTQDPDAPLTPAASVGAAAEILLDKLHTKECLSDEGSETDQEDKISVSRQNMILMVLSPTFQWTMGLIVILNAAMLGVEIEVVTPSVPACTPKELSSLDARCSEEAVFYLLDYVFLFIFSIELGIRLFAFGVLPVATHSTGALDIFIVLSGWVSEVFIPLVLAGSSGGLDLKALQILKMLRVLRAVRVLRMLTMFKDLWFIVQSFLLCLGPLLWITIFILVVIYLWSLGSVNLIGNNSEFAEVQNYFGSTSRAMVTLFRIMTLDQWYEILIPVFQAGSWTYVFFLIYAAVSALALMNLVTAIVVDTSVHRSRSESEGELRKQIFEERVEEMAEDIKSLFVCFDADDSGFLDQEEFVRSALEAPLIGRLCEFLCISEKEDLDQLYRLMAGSDELIQMDEFIECITKISQAASDRSSVAMIKSARTRDERFSQIQKILEKQKELGQQLAFVEDEFSAAGERLDAFHVRLRVFQDDVMDGIKGANQDLEKLSKWVSSHVVKGEEEVKECKGEEEQRGHKEDAGPTTFSVSQTEPKQVLREGAPQEDKPKMKVAKVKSLDRDKRSQKQNWVKNSMPWSRKEKPTKKLPT